MTHSDLPERFPRQQQMPSRESLDGGAPYVTQAGRSVHTGSAGPYRNWSWGRVSHGKGQGRSVKDNVTALPRGEPTGCPRGRFGDAGPSLPWPGGGPEPGGLLVPGCAPASRGGGVALSERRDKAPRESKGPLCTGCLQHTRSPVHSSSVWPVTEA